MIRFSSGNKKENNKNLFVVLQPRKEPKPGISETTARDRRLAVGASGRTHREEAEDRTHRDVTGA